MVCFALGSVIMLASSLYVRVLVAKAWRCHSRSGNRHQILLRTRTQHSTYVFTDYTALQQLPYASYRTYHCTGRKCVLLAGLQLWVNAGV